MVPIDILNYYELKSVQIAVTDTFPCLNPNSNLVKVGNQADGEVMASGLRAQGCEFKYQFMLSPTLKPEVQKKA